MQTEMECTLQQSCSVPNDLTKHHDGITIAHPPEKKKMTVIKLLVIRSNVSSNVRTSGIKYTTSTFTGRRIIIMTAHLKVEVDVTKWQT
jgi:hypothetical protein